MILKKRTYLLENAIFCNKSASLYDSLEVLLLCRDNMFTSVSRKPSGKPTREHSLDLVSIDYDTNCNNFDYAYVSGSPLCLFNLRTLLTT